MDFSLGEDRQMLVNSLGRFLAGNFDWKTREQVIASSEGWSRDLWRQLADLGVIGALFDEESGGYAGSPFDVGVVFGEVGRALAVGPFLGTLMAGRVLAATGRADLLERVIAGEVILSAALEAATLRAVVAGDGWSLSGSQAVVPFAASADHIVVAATTAQGPSLFLVDKGASGLSIQSYPLVDGGAAGELRLDGVPATLLGEAGQAAPIIEAVNAVALVGLCWEAVSIMDVVKDQTLEYLRTRKQFGIAIGKFQALQHRMATLALEIEQARSAAINAAARFQEGRITREKAVSAAKYTIGRVGTLAAEEAIQLHGGIGMTWELPLSHYAKRLVMIGHQLGDEDHHLERFIALGRESAAA
ncbi:acyl-CoA dehydrogenase family protein [Niveispirillum fermenti]|uniref:acyl-CoA dehydrogenase family protein n=1 Tax=Niveispirillum fermenti TaxID=1233113 RepID=UPI003A8AFA0A